VPPVTQRDSSEGRKQVPADTAARYDLIEHAVCKKILLLVIAAHVGEGQNDD
jgi:hypothetical protein